MIVGMSANLLSRRAASPDLGRRAFGVWAFAAIGSPVALARAATLPTVASLRFGPHPPLEADGRGFVAGLAKSGFHVGENILLAQHDCQGSMANANTLAAELLRAQPAVLHVSATPSAQAVNSAHGVAPQVPVVFSSVTDPVGAGIVPAGIPAGQALGGNLTGVSSPWPVELQLQTYAQIAPRARRWGTLYNASESNSISHVRRLRQAATQLKLELVEITVRRPDDVAAAAAALAERADAILIVADNTADARLEAIAKVCNERRRPQGRAGAQGPERGRHSLGAHAAVQHGHQPPRRRRARPGAGPRAAGPGRPRAPVSAAMAFRPAAGAMRAPRARRLGTPA